MLLDGWISSSYVGSAFAIGGNILIAFALNTQKLAHERLSRPKQRTRRDASHRKRTGSPLKALERLEVVPLLNDRTGDTSKIVAGDVQAISIYEPGRIQTIPETESSAPIPLESKSDRLRRKWLHIRRNNSDNILAASSLSGSRKIQTTIHIRDDRIRDLSPGRRNIKAESRASRQRPRPITTESTISRSSAHSRDGEPDLYLKSKVWWLGLALMAVGELGNFTSYAFAPASIVAPLGTTALIANCFIAPVLLQEKFRKQDVVGIALSVAGAVIVVLAGNEANRSLRPPELIAAISQPAFIVYSSICLALILILSGLSQTRAGSQYLAIDILVCAFSGGFTVLSTKAFGSFLTIYFLGCFRYWITYPVLAVLISTAIIQIAFLNRALRRFEARVVVPAQFVSFTISAIVGSAILFRDFEDVSLRDVFVFFTGCILVFIGVVTLTRAKNAPTDEEVNTATASDAARRIRSRETEVSPVAGSTAQSPSANIETGLSIPSESSPARTRRHSQPTHKTIRKYSSFGTFTRSDPASTAIATGIPLRTGHSLATSRIFSPGYVLIASRFEGSHHPRLSLVDVEDLENSISGLDSSSSSERLHLSRGASPAIGEGDPPGESAADFTAVEEPHHFNGNTSSVPMSRRDTV